MITKLAKSRKMQAAIYYTIIGIAFYVMISYWNKDWIFKARMLADDYVTWLEWKNNDFFQYIFSTSANKIRPVANLLISISNYIVGNKPYLLMYILRAVQTIIALYVCYIATQISQNKIIGICAGACCAISCFSYYVITQQLGIMEGAALLFALVMLYLIFLYLNQDKNECLYFCLATIFYLLALFSHERFFILFPMFVIAYAFKNGKKFFNRCKFKILIFPTTVFVFQLLLRILLFRNRFLDGTGGKAISETFNAKQVLTQLWECFLYLFGIHNGNTGNYLAIVGFAELPQANKFFVMYSSILLLGSFLFFVAILLQNKEKRVQVIKNISIFICFIGAMLLASAITFRVELRWIYICYAAFVILYSYVLGEIWKTKRKLSILAPACSCLYLALLLPQQKLLNAGMGNLYLSASMIMGNHIYSEIIEKEGAALWDKSVLVVGPGAELTLPILEQYTPDGKATPQEIFSVLAIDDITAANENVDIIYAWNPASNAFEEYVVKGETP